MHSLKRFRLVSVMLAVFLLLGMMVDTASAQRRRRNRQAGKAKAAKRIGIGTAAGAGVGALVNGKKGALIGAGAGAAGGTAYHYHKKRQGRRRLRNRYSRPVNGTKGSSTAEWHRRRALSILTAGYGCHLQALTRLTLLRRLTRRSGSSTIRARVNAWYASARLARPLRPQDCAFLVFVVRRWCAGRGGLGDAERTGRG